ncbi:MAG: winged helix-turn-helix domain-containing protein [Nitrososphaerota archaeon]|nr:winged helix-turn-helix domain-containing protein [Nitrososphaerota archaeon]MDG7048869.1 winged helix-turn-helix domain-containing protein [Nitrososphaerota archaeon]MDG7051392.1 winged helix-turn-helix domain-containing protein [Nitrososphaerota archaeon]
MRYSPSQVVRILHSPNFSWQKPEGVAREHDEEKVREWVKDELPKIKKSWMKPTASS